MTEQEKIIKKANENEVLFLFFDLDIKHNKLKVDGKTYENISYIRYDVNKKLYTYFNTKGLIVYDSTKPLVIFTNQFVYVHYDDLENQSILSTYNYLLYKYIVD